MTTTTAAVPIHSKTDDSLPGAPMLGKTAMIRRNLKNRLKKKKEKSC
jgi:hypothetical protein